MVSCIICGDIMNAVYSYEARNTCHDCGGQAFIDSKEDLEDRKNAKLVNRLRKSKL